MIFLRKITITDSDGQRRRLTRDMVDKIAATVADLGPDEESPLEPILYIVQERIQNYVRCNCEPLKFHQWARLSDFEARTLADEIAAHELNKIRNLAVAIGHATGNDAAEAAVPNPNDEEQNRARWLAANLVEAQAIMKGGATVQGFSADQLGGGFDGLTG